MAELAEIKTTAWDVIVIGTGIGGGTAGRALAEAGLKVLFLEMGRSTYRKEETSIDQSAFDPVARAIRGLWPVPVDAKINGTPQSVFAPLGSGLGGSSVFYAATLERPEPHDLDDSAARRHPTGGWPVSFAKMLPWYDKAQKIYHVNGTPDPLSDQPIDALRAGPAPSPGDAAIIARLQANGLNPYQLHAAIARLPGCAECLGRKCPRACKMDGRSAGVEPALSTGRAALLTRCEVTRLNFDQGQVTSVTARIDQEDVTLSAPHFVLAAGALSSPRILLASTSEAAPTGIGNGADQVGRNLMFHLNEMFAIWPGKSAGEPGPSKSVGFRDLYFAEGQRLGMVQAMGVDVGYGEIVHYLRQRVENSSLKRVPGALDATRIPAAIGAKLLGTAKVFVGLLEDLPYPENRVLHDPEDTQKITLNYQISDELMSRRHLFRRLIKRSFRGTRTAFLNQRAEPNLGHPCGTLKMGEDPRTSATTPDGRVHGASNLWVTDASIFPTSMGVNPSLTIAANALRVADNILQSAKGAS